MTKTLLKKMSQKQSNSNNTVSTRSANIDIVIGFQSGTSTSENSEISVYLIQRYLALQNLFCSRIELH